MPDTTKKLAPFIAGVLFALLWASASTATKIGLSTAQPLIIAEARFALAALVMLFVAHVLLKHRLPRKEEWKPIAVYGFLNISVYLGLYVFAMRSVTAGIGALAVASNPVLIALLSVFVLGKKLHFFLLVSFFVCASGIVCASWPLLRDAGVNVPGLLLLFLSMLSYSAGAIYFSSRRWVGLSLLAINGWQTVLGGLFLLPGALFFYKTSANRFDGKFWWSVSWLALPVSVFAVQLWLWLLRWDTIRAGLWLFLCPLFGFLIAFLAVKEEISMYTVSGLVFVIIGLMLSRWGTKEKVPD